jgi:multicomponent K+:H+ antiporter subunit E
VTTLRSWVPAPLLSVALLVAWLVLARSVDAASVVLGLLLALALPRITAQLWPSGVRVRRPALVLRYVSRVAGDVALSNLAVARDVLRWRWRPPQPRFVVVPLDLREPVGLAVLAMVTTIVPGTVWCELAVDKRALLLHAWHVEDEVDFVARFKLRYEQPLRRIFE